MPSFAHTETVAAAPERVFAIIDDTSRTQEWLARCTGIDKLSEGENHAGTRLRYHYRDGRRTGAMEGEISAREPGRSLSMHFTDAMMEVEIDFRTAPMGADTSLTHEIRIHPRGFGRLFTPMIRRSLPKQALAAMTSLRKLAEAQG